MAASLKLIFPTTVDRRNPCCCISQSILHEQILLDTITNPTGYTGTGVITVRENEYDVNAVLSVAGDQIGGNISFLHRRRNITTNNLLANQRTPFPSVPIFNEWNGLRMNGFGDTGILELSDRDINDIDDSGLKNDSVSAIFEATAVQSGVILTTDKKEFALDGSDDEAWTTRPSSITLRFVNELIAATTIQFNLDEFALLVRPGYTQILGKVTSYSRPDASSSAPAIVASQQFTSPYTTSLYNTVFPWSNQWSLIDNANPSVSLLDPEIMLPVAPSPGFGSDIQIIVSIKVTGLQA